MLRSFVGARVNQTQLAAEVRGYNQAMRDLQVTVMRLAADDVFGLAEAVEQLERLEQHRQFLDLYREGLTTAEKSRLPASPSVELVRELVRRKANELAHQTPPNKGAERRALEQLNARLADLGGSASR